MPRFTQLLNGEGCLMPKSQLLMSQSMSYLLHSYSHQKLCRKVNADRKAFRYRCLTIQPALQKASTTLWFRDSKLFMIIQIDVYLNIFVTLYFHERQDHFFSYLKSICLCFKKKMMICFWEELYVTQVFSMTRLHIKK